ncbi:MAG: SOS response-associated peptidase [Myxococcota bacterium]|nr:SOS response-associated peptidase [Myxococcota bacterium]
MCGRYQLTLPGLDLETSLGIPPPSSYEPRYNLAPTQAIPIIRMQVGQKTMAMARWGLIPSWSKQGPSGKPLINARSETVAEKPSFRDALRWGRCLVPATGFYEWRRSDAHRIPHLIRVKSTRVFTMAGIGTRWLGPDGPVESVAVLTVNPRGALKDIHDRMPVILDELGAGQWLDPTTPKARILDLCTPWPSHDVTIIQVDPWVNAVAHDDPRCEAPVAIQPTLF